MSNISNEKYNYFIHTDNYFFKNINGILVKLSISYVIWI
ncbi:hypothetical protein LLB_0649 [Legionella longbeachae D-4968]|nr:hypothetical protein LLB_0649 [Legionella longbeachae D-4968]